MQGNVTHQRGAVQPLAPQLQQVVANLQAIIPQPNAPQPTAANMGGQPANQNQALQQVIAQLQNIASQLHGVVGPLQNIVAQLQNIIQTNQQNGGHPQNGGNQQNGEINRMAEINRIAEINRVENLSIRR